MEDVFLPNYTLEVQAVWLSACTLILLFFLPLFWLLCPCWSGGGTVAVPLLECVLCVRKAGCSSAAPGWYQTPLCSSCTQSPRSLKLHQRCLQSWLCGEDEQRSGPQVEGPLGTGWVTCCDHRQVTPKKWGKEKKTVSYLEFLTAMTRFCIEKKTKNSRFILT